MNYSTVFTRADMLRSKYSDRRLLLESYALALAGFTVSFTIGHPQILVGAAVNAMLYRAALTLPSKKALPLIVSPSLGALSRGLVFGPYTALLVYLLPFIWAGNLILYYAASRLGKILKYSLATIFAAAALKAAFLYSSALLLTSQEIIPPIFLSLMGVMQFTTAIAGGLITLIFLRLEHYRRIN